MAVSDDKKMSQSDKAALVAAALAIVGGAYLVKGKRAAGFRRGARRAMRRGRAYARVARRSFGRRRSFRRRAF
jgi:hypothetical protein